MEVETSIRLRRTQDSLEAKLGVEQVSRVCAHPRKRSIEVHRNTHHFRECVGHEIPDIGRLRDSLVYYRESQGGDRVVRHSRRGLESTIYVERHRASTLHGTALAVNRA